jgi:phage baseplate assembly protein W
MSINSEISYPFTIDTDGTVGVETNPENQISNHVQGLVSTQPGQRVMMSAYGVDTAVLLFEPNSSFVAAQVRESVQQQLSLWEPGAILQNVSTIPSPDGTASIEVDYTRSDSVTSPTQLARHVNTAIIQVGGTVTEVVNG